MGYHGVISRLFKHTTPRTENQIDKQIEHPSLRDAFHLKVEGRHVLLTMTGNAWQNVSFEEWLARILKGES